MPQPKETTVIQALNLEPFNYQANAPTTRLYCLTNTHTHTHTHIHTYSPTHTYNMTCARKIHMYTHLIDMIVVFG